MKIQKVLKIGVAAGFLAYGCKTCEKFLDTAAADLVKARETSKMYVKYKCPQKYDSLMNAGMANNTKAWLDTENAILDSLNNQSNYNKVFVKTAKDTLKYIK